MSNLATLITGGVISAANALSDADKATIESLSGDEVTALISIHSKVGADFLTRNCSSPTPSPAHPVGIVF